jgi:hypothetical protein
MLTKISTVNRGWRHLVHIDWEGTAPPSLGERQSSENAVPMREWHGLEVSFELPSDIVTPPAWAEFVELAAPLIETARAGFECKWDGSNEKGWLNESARGAREALEALIQDHDWRGDWSYWDVGDWLAPARHEIKAEMTDAALTEWAKACEELAAEGHIILDGDVLEWATEVRAEKRADEAYKDMD